MTRPSAADPATTAARILADLHESEYRELARRAQGGGDRIPAVDPQVHLVSLAEQIGANQPARPIALDDAAAKIQAALTNPGDDRQAVLETFTVQVLREFATRLLREGATETYVHAVIDLALAVSLARDTVA